METAINILQRTPLYIHDDSHNFEDQLYQPFAWGDVFLREVNRDCCKSILHIWPMTNTLILGMLDRRLPHCDLAIKTVRTHGYRAVVRNVGGLAVVADDGILNFSFILPNAQHQKISITQAYEMMYQFIVYLFRAYNKTIEHFEISESYCPGDYDLSIDGQKFAGLAQRRFKDGIMISIYLSVNGNQQQRGELVKLFYEHGLQNETVNFKFPTVNPNVMANLSELLMAPLTVQSVKEHLINSIHQLDISCQKLEISSQMKKDFKQFHEKMIERNRKV